MEVEIRIEKEAVTPKAVIYTSAVTDEIRKAADWLSGGPAPQEVFTVKEEERYEVIRREDIFMVRVEGSRTVVYGEKTSYSTTKRLYEWEEALGSGFMRISKTTLVNLKQIQSVESSFKGMMYLKLKNHCEDYISRRYLTEFKKYLGLNKG